VALSTRSFTDTHGREWVQVDGTISTQEELTLAKRMIPMSMQSYVHILDGSGNRPDAAAGRVVGEAVHPDTGVAFAGRPLGIGSHVSWTALKDTP
jgi:hypothetical protein